ncbi:MAG: Ldh family oxidoreductase [Qingshengfaniella sp.]
MPPSKTLVSADALTPHMARILMGYGVLADHATVMADQFTWAALRGVDSHGVVRLPATVEMFAKGVANPAPQMVETRPRSATAMIDADFAPGAIAMTRAVDLGVDMARETGVAWVQVKRTVHAGAVGYFVERAARAGMIGIVMLTGMPNMSYPGAAAAGVATSPIALGVPSADGPPFLLDMATAVIAFGKIKQHALRGETLPEASAVGADGQITTDPEVAKWPLPLGGMKGAGLSLGFELVTSVLAGMPTLAPIHHGEEGAKRHRQNAVVIVMDPTVFGEAATFQAAVAETLAAIRGLPRMDGVEAIGIPGDRGEATAKNRRKTGVPLPEKLYRQLVELAEATGIAPLTPIG